MTTDNKKPAASDLSAAPCSVPAWTYGKQDGLRARRNASGRIEVFAPRTIEGDYQWKESPHYPQRFQAAPCPVRCPLACPHDDQCTLEKGHDDGCNHAGCDCNEPNAPLPYRSETDGTMTVISRGKVFKYLAVDDAYYPISLQNTKIGQSDKQK